jgi:hypothetical protein
MTVNGQAGRCWGGALLSLCAFLAPDIPRGLPREQPQLLPEELAQAVSDPLAYNRLLAVAGRCSLATVTSTSLGVHRLVQAVLQARLGHKGERRWIEVTVGLLRESFRDESWEVGTWPGLRATATARAGRNWACGAAAGGWGAGRLAARPGVDLPA